MTLRFERLALLLVAVGAWPCAAEDAAPKAPVNYVAGFAGTTLQYRPPGGELEGFQHDLTVLLGYGRQLTPTLALELDFGPTFVRGDYTSFSLTPGLVWALHPNLYWAKLMTPEAL